MQDAQTAKTTTATGSSDLPADPGAAPASAASRLPGAVNRASTTTATTSSTCLSVPSALRPRIPTGGSQKSAMREHRRAPADRPPRRPRRRPRRGSDVPLFDGRQHRLPRGQGGDPGHHVPAVHRQRGRHRRLHEHAGELRDRARQRSSRLDRRRGHFTSASPSATTATLKAGTTGLSSPADDLRQLFLAPSLDGSPAAGAWTLGLRDLSYSASALLSTTGRSTWCAARCRRWSYSAPDPARSRETPDERRLPGRPARWWRPPIR